MADLPAYAGSFTDELPTSATSSTCFTGAAPAWHRDGACREQPELTWFPETRPEAVAARRVCDSCLVRWECLEWALAQGPDLDGMWAGTTQRQRRNMEGESSRVYSADGERQEGTPGVRPVA